MAPYSGTSYDLARGTFVVRTEGVARQKAPAGRDPRALAAFNELMTAVKKLELLVQGAGGRPNKELKQMARQAEKLYEEWNEARL